MDSPNRVQLHRFRILSFMIGEAVLAVVFGILRSVPRTDRTENTSVVSPIAEPIGHYYLGECRRHLGDSTGALEEFRLATAPGIDSHHARLAEQRALELFSDRASGS